jgi:phage N-6-adenine-methyltransferase
MSEPAQKPGRSRQDYRTPPAFLVAVKSYLGLDDFAFDFACTPENAVAPNHFYDADALKMDWVAALGCHGWGWLNPPYADIRPWAQKAYEASTDGGRIAMLIPAAVGSNWWREWVNRKADVLFLNGRLTFVGCTDPFPKDCALLLYTPLAYATQGSYDVWDWRRQPSRTVDAVATPMLKGTPDPSRITLFSGLEL